MSIKDIITVPDDTLKKISSPIEKVGVYEKKLMNDLLETMYNSKGIGLAAVQVGILKRVLVIDVSEEIQILRTRTRDNVPEEQVKTIILSQINRSERLRLATHIIENEKTLEDLEKAVKELHQKIIMQIENK